MTFAKDSRDLLIECCVEFITLISSEANEIAEKDAKKTIAAEHVQKALEELDFHDYVPAILAVERDFKDQQKVCACSLCPNTLQAHCCISLRKKNNNTRLTSSRTARRNKQKLSRAA